MRPTHLLSHPGRILGEVAHLPGQEALTFLQERVEPWDGRRLRNEHPTPYAWHHQDRLSWLSRGPH